MPFWISAQQRQKRYTEVLFRTLPAVIPNVEPGISASLGFEPRQRDPESLVLPLHHEATSEKTKDRCAALQVRRRRVQDGLRGRDFCFEHDFAAFLRRCDFQRLSAFCDEFASGFGHRLNHPVIVIWVVVKKQKRLHFRVERQ